MGHFWFVKVLQEIRIAKVVERLVAGIDRVTRYVNVRVAARHVPKKRVFDGMDARVFSCRCVLTTNQDPLRSGRTRERR